MERKSIKTDELTHSRLMYIADTLNMPLTHFLRELGEQLFDLFSEYEKGANIFYDATRHKLIITTFGKSKLIVGSAPNDEIAKTQIEGEIEKREG